MAQPYRGPQLYPRGKVWWAWIDGARVSTRCKSLPAAQAAALRLEREAHDPAHKAARTTSLDHALTALLAARAARRKAPATLRYTTTKAGNLLRVLGREAPIAAIDDAAVDRYVGQRLREAVPGTLRPVSAHTVDKELVVLLAALRLMKRHGKLAGELPRKPDGWSAEYRPRDTWLTVPQAWALIEALAATGYPGARGRAAHVAFLFGTGARMGEASRAEKADVGAGTVVVRGTKTAAAADTIPILELTRALVDYARDNAPNATGPMFAPWPVGNYRRDLARACRRAGVPRATPNDLRRSLASWLAQAGVPADLTRRVLRHRDTRMVERVYARMGPADLGRAIDRAVSNLYGSNLDQPQKRAPTAPPDGQKPQPPAQGGG